MSDGVVRLFVTPEAREIEVADIAGQDLNSLNAGVRPDDIPLSRIRRGSCSDVGPRNNCDSQMRVFRFQKQVVCQPIGKHPGRRQVQVLTICESPTQDRGSTFRNCGIHVFSADGCSDLTDRRANLRES